MPYEELRQLTKTNFSLEYYESEGRRRTLRFDTLELTLSFLLDQDSVLNAADFKSIPFVDFVAFWKHEELTVAGKTETTLKSHVNFLNRFAIPNFGSVPIGEITASHFRAYYNAAADADTLFGKMKASTLRVLVSIMTGILKLAHSRRCLEANPTDEFKANLPRRRKDDPSVVIPEQDHMAAMYPNSTPTQMFHLNLLCEVGAKPAECARMQHSDFKPFYLLSNAVEVSRIFLRDVVLKGDDEARPEGRLMPISDATLCSYFLHKSRRRRLHGSRAEVFGSLSVVNKSLSHLQRYCGLIRPYKTSKDGQDMGLYVPADFNHLAAVRWIDKGYKAKQLSLLMGLSEAVIWQRYGSMLALKVEDDQTATARASGMVVAAIAQLSASLGASR